MARKLNPSQSSRRPAASPAGSGMIGALSLIALVSILPSAVGASPAGPAGRWAEAPRAERLQVPGVEVPRLGRLDLELERFEVFTDDARLLRDERPEPLPARLAGATFWRGEIPGGDRRESARVVLMVDPDGRASGVIAAPGERYRLESGPDGNLVATIEPVEAEAFGSAAEASAYAADYLPIPDAARQAAARLGRAAEAKKKTYYAPPGALVATIALETDHDLLARNLGDVDLMLQKAVQFIAETSVVTNAEFGLALEVNLVSFWTTPDDPWSSTGDGVDLLYELKDYWERKRPYSKFPRSAVHMVTGRPNLDVGGIAFVEAACSGTWKDPYDFGLSRTNVQTIAHELGHTFGSHHTHCYDPPVDQCWSRQDGCYAGPEMLPPDGGSLMSYCSERTMSFGAPGKFGTSSERVLQVLRAYTESVYAGCIGHQTDPFELGATDVTPTSATLQWKDIFEGEKSWTVEVYAGKKFKVAKSTKANETSLALTKLKPGQTYLYRVFAKFNNGESERSFTFALTPQ